MEKHYQMWPFNFGAIHRQDFKKAKIVIVPVPYEGTVSFNGGTRNGPYAIISNSRYLDELFDSRGEELIGINSTDIFTLDELELSADSPKEAMEGVRQAIENEVLKYNKIPLMLGGEHSITLGAVRALKKKYPDLSVLQLDAHADLIDEYAETKYSHACVMRRIKELGVKTVQVGIRNINTEIRDYFKNPSTSLPPSPRLRRAGGAGKKMTGIYFAPKIPVAAIMKSLSKHVYLTLDVDVFDPSIMPSTGTPEPGGLGWYEVLNLIEKAAKNKKIVGADVVELAPIPGFYAPDFLTAKLVYKIINYIV